MPRERATSLPASPSRAPAPASNPVLVVPVAGKRRPDLFIIFVACVGNLTDVAPIDHGVCRFPYDAGGKTASCFYISAGHSSARYSAAPLATSNSCIAKRSSVVFNRLSAGTIWTAACVARLSIDIAHSAFG